MLKGWFSFHSLPRYKYRGFEYVPDVDEDPDDGSRKIWHHVYHFGKRLPFKESPRWPAREWPDEDEFKAWVDEKYPD